MTDPHPPVRAARGDVPASIDDDPTIGRLVITVFKETQTLFQQLLALVKSELKVSVGISALGIGLVAGAAFFALMGLIMLSFGFAYLIVLAGLHPAWGFLIVFAAYLLLAGALGFVGVKKIRSVRPVPERTKHQVQETTSMLKK